MRGLSDQPGSVHHWLYLLLTDMASFFDGFVLKATLTQTLMRPLAAELPLWQIDICNLREAVTQHPPDGRAEEACSRLNTVCLEIIILMWELRIHSRHIGLRVQNVLLCTDTYNHAIIWIRRQCSALSEGF